MQNGTDLHIAPIRQALESMYGQLFSDAVSLRNKLDDSALSDAEYDAEVIGLVGSTILTVRPIAPHLRRATGSLLGLAEEDRSDLVGWAPPGGNETALRSDRYWVHAVVQSLGTCLYPVESYLPALTDTDCDREWYSSEVLAVADANGVIPPEVASRLRKKLVAQKAKARKVESSSEWQTQLIDLIDNASSIGSAIVCIPSEVRVERCTVAGIIPAVRKGNVITSHLLPTERTPFDAPQIYSVPRR